MTKSETREARRLKARRYRPATRAHIVAVGNALRNRLRAMEAPKARKTA